MAAVILLLLATVAAGCGGDDDNGTTTTAATTTTDTGAETDGMTETTETETGGTDTGMGTDTGAASAEGAAVFDSAGCGTCHTFAAAGSTATIGPNLDDSTVSQDQVEEQVRNGSGAMPAFEGQLSDEEIEAVAAYVVENRS